MTLDHTDELQTALATLAKSNKAKTLFITHQWGGGVEQHIQDLLDLLGKDLDILVLRGAGQGGVEIDLPAESGRQKFQVGGFTAEQLPLWIASFQTLGLEIGRASCRERV